MNNIPEIRDIYIPDGVSIFPLAYGWWVILGCIVCLFIAIKIIFFLIKTSKKYYALKSLKEINTNNPISAAIQISELLRRISNTKYPEGRAIYGEEWIIFLNKHSLYKLPEKSAELLMFAPFINPEDKSYSSSEVETLIDFSKKWIGENL